MKLFFLKKIWSKIKQVRIEDLLQILLIATVVLIATAIIKPDLVGPSYGTGPPLTAYFDVFVRYGRFIFIYFTLIPILILWLVKKALKEKWNPKTGFSFLILSLLVLIMIYSIVPGPIHRNPFNIPEYKSLLYDSVSDAVEKFQKIEEIEHDFCGKRIDFLYSAGCSVNKLTPVLETIKNELEDKDSEIEFYVWCASTDEKPCEEYEKGEYDRNDVVNLYKEYNLKSLPALVLGCKHVASGKFELEEYKKLICEKLNECDL